MPHPHRFAPLAVLATTIFSLNACQSADSPRAPAAPTEAPSASSAVSAPAGLTGEDFLSKADTLSGTTVSLARCSLLTTPGGDGTLPCRVLDTGGTDIKDANGLPVDIFVKESDLSPDAKAVVSTCEGFCTVAITGRLDRATDGTGYLSMTDVSLTKVG